MVKRIGLVLAALLLVGVTGCGVDRKSPEAVAEAFVTAVKKMNGKQIIKLSGQEVGLLPRDMQGMMLSEIESGNGEVLRKGAITFEKIKSEDDRVVISVLVDGTKVRYVTLARSGEKWYVKNISLWW